MSNMTLWGFDGSTYVRTVKMLLAEKAATDFKQVQTNVLAGEPKTAEHLARHPFGKVPVLDHDGLRILETSAIVRYLNDVVPGKSLVPVTPKGRARMDMMMSSIRTAMERSLAVSLRITFSLTSWAARTTRCARPDWKTDARSLNSR